MKLPKNFRPLHDLVLVKRDPPKATISGIVIPETSQENCQEATVISFGKEVKDVKKGDRVLVTKASFHETEDGLFAIIRELDIHGILETV